MRRFTPHAVACLALALAACATRATLAPDALRERLDAVGARHERIARSVAKADGEPTPWPLAKAGCWLDAARADFERDENAGFAEGAAAEADQLLAAIESGRPVDVRTRLVADSWRLRSDLWARADALKRSSAHACLASRTACAEVWLVQAGHAHSLGGWAWSKPYLALVEAELAAIESASARCANAEAPRDAVVVLPPALVPRPEGPPVASMRGGPLAERATDVHATIATDILFAFGQSSLAAMTAQGRDRLDRLADEIRSVLGDDVVVDVAGHADRIGEAAWNLRLSEARASTVADYLVSRGIAASSVRAVGEGQAKPVVLCDGPLAWTALVRCLGPNRRVEIRASGSRR